MFSGAFWKHEVCVELVVDWTSTLARLHFKEGTLHVLVPHPLKAFSPVPSNAGYRDSWGF